MSEAGVRVREEGFVRVVCHRLNDSDGVMKCRGATRAHNNMRKVRLTHNRARRLDPSYTVSHSPTHYYSPAVNGLLEGLFTRVAPDIVGPD